MAIGRRGSRFRSIGGLSAFGNAVAATLTTNLTGTNNDLKFTAWDKGTAGNAIDIAYVVAGASTPLTVQVNDATKTITVNVATNGSSVATSTSAQVMAAIQALPAAAKYVKVENAAGNDGTGVVTALASTPLAGGTDWTLGYTGSGIRTRRGH